MLRSNVPPLVLFGVYRNRNLVPSSVLWYGNDTPSFVPNMGRDDPERLSDDFLAQRFNETRDNRFLEEIWSRYGSCVFASCLRFLHRPADAEDATANTFLRARRGLEKGNYHGGNLHAWLLTIARRVCVNETRLAWERLRVDCFENLPKPPSSVASQELIARIHSVFDKLTKEQRITLKLKYLHGFTDAEIAKMKGWTLKMVKTYAQNGRRMFMKYWNE